MKSVLAIAFITSPTLVPHVAHADLDKASCVDSATKGQVLRDEGKLRDAKAAFTTCSQAACPSVVRASCGEWLAEVDAKLPPAPPKPSVEERPVAAEEPAPVAPARPTTTTTTRPIPLGVWILGGAGVAGVGGFAYFGLTAQHDLDRLRATCGAACSGAAKDAAYRTAWLADVSLGAGAAAFLGAGIWYLLRPETTAAAPSITVGSRSAQIAVLGTF